MNKKMGLSLALCLGLAIVGNIYASDAITEQQAGFLPDYSVLKQIPSPEGTKLYTYKNPDVEPGDYKAVMVAPVSLYQSESTTKLSADQIDQIKTNIHSGLKQIVGKKIKVTKKSGPGIARLDTAITGANLEKDGFKLRNLVPVSAAVTLASKATGLDNKTPVLVIELKFTDSETGELLKETVTTISGEKFRQAADTPEAFDKLVNQWVQQAMTYSASADK